MSSRLQNRTCLIGSFAAIAAIAACATPAPPEAEAAPSLREQYVALQREAVESVKIWQASAGDEPDPRPELSTRLEVFARENPGTEEAGDALMGAMELRAARLDVEGFFGTYDTMLEVAPDAPGLQEVLSQIPIMRTIEAGGPFVLHQGDREAKERAYRAAVPRIAADLHRALTATASAANRAAAHYELGLTYYQFDVDPVLALDHFSILVLDFPQSAMADSARRYAAELERLAVGKPAPGFEAVRLNGKSISLAGLKGNIVLIDFWATWCQPCIDELPHLLRAWDRYRGRGFVIVGVNLDTDLPAVRNFVGQHGIGWPTIAAGLGMDDPLVGLYSVQRIPMSYLVDRDGAIRGRALFGRDVERAVGALIDP